MRAPTHDVKAPKQTVSLTLNSDLYTRAKRLGINASHVAEQALAAEVGRRQAEALRSEILQDLASCDAYVARHGAFADMVREHYQQAGDDEADE